MENKEQYTVNEIKVDDKTLEPKIIESKKPSHAHIEKELRQKHKKEDKEDRRSIGKQMVMKHIIGYVPSETEKRQNLYKHIFTAVFVIMVLGVLAWTFYNDFLSPEALENPPSFSQIGAVFAENWFYLIFVFIALFCCFLFKGLKLSIMCKYMTGRWRFATCFETGIIGHYYNNVTPLAAGGQPFEIYHLSKHGVHGGVASSMPIAAFFMYQLAMVTLSIIALIFFIPSINPLILPDEIILSSVATILRPMAIVGCFFGVLMPLIVILFCIFPKVANKIVGWVINLGAKLKLVKNKEKTTERFIANVNQNAKCLTDLTKNTIVFIASFLISVCEVLSLCSIAYFTLRAFGFDFSEAWSIWEWGQIITVCLVFYSSVSFIPTPGNSGAADVSFYWLFKLSLVAIHGLSFPAMLTWRILSYYSFVIIGFLFTTLKRKNDRRKERLGIPLYKD